ncbi:TetR/AcrR family transcriptional regulator [Streptomyces sp. 6N106]|uniref:TetR/AcrR family transcriptional regulator n=1 Tax=Streptomyces sp. 6N106 TaxID=3457418 RepID=UPI003FD42002
MTELEKGPTGRRRGRGARERIISASQQLFREQGINRTGMDQLCAAAQVSKRTAYQHFTGKDELVAEYLRRFDPAVLSGVFDRTDLTPRERLLAAFDIPPHHPPVPLHRRRRRAARPPAPRGPVRTRLQESRRRAARRHRPRSRRRRP